MKINLSLPADLVEQLRSRSAEEDRPMSSIVRRALRAAFDVSPPATGA